MDRHASEGGQSFFAVWSFEIKKLKLTPEMAILDFYSTFRPLSLKTSQTIEKNPRK